MGNPDWAWKQAYEEVKKIPLSQVGDLWQAISKRADELRAQGAVRDLTWIPAEQQPPSRGMYEVTVDTDEGAEVLILEFDGKNWIHDGEPTYCHGYYIEVKLWRDRDAPGEFERESDES